MNMITVPDPQAGFRHPPKSGTVHLLHSLSQQQPDKNMNKITALLSQSKIVVLVNEADDKLICFGGLFNIDIGI